MIKMVEMVVGLIGNNGVERRLQSKAQERLVLQGH